MAISRKFNQVRVFRSSGFTLVELVIGIVMSAVALTAVTTLIFPLITRSVEPMFQVRAAELAQAVLEDALSKNYDHSTPVGGQPPCLGCSTSMGLETGESDRGDINDVDDYNVFCGNQSIEDITGNVISDAGDDYAGFEFSVCVGLDGNYNGIAGEGGDASDTAKLITVTVIPPPATNASPVTLSAYRTNY